MLRSLFLLLISTALGGCQMGYYAHLARGHLALMADAEPVAELMAAPDTEEDLKKRLALAQSALAFAGTELGLPADGAYSDYVSLPRDHVVWNLVAAEPFSLTPKQWCYPIVGCASYRGFFDRDRAARYRAQLEGQGLEVYGSGAIAYSTLGWFDDPLTSAMLEGAPGWTVELLFHELVHRRLYVKGDTRFNESLATAVAREGRRRWLARNAPEETGLAWRQHEQAAARVESWIHEARTRLAAIYDSNGTDAQKAADKVAVQDWLRETYRQALAQDPVYAPWQAWFEGPLNNAQLALRQDYLGGVPAFNALLLECGGRLACFWERVEDVAALPDSERQRWLEENAK